MAGSETPPRSAGLDRAVGQDRAAERNRTADPIGVVWNSAADGRPAPVGRDRDSAGRARNSRPRDALGRPLPYGSADVARAPEGIVRTPEETITEAQRLLDAGLPFHAHEIFEDAWKTAGAPGDGTSGGSCATGAADRGLWKGLAQIAVGLTHLARGSNDRGAQTLLRRGAAAIDPYRQDRPYGLDIGSIVSWATALADQLDPVGGQRVGPADVSATGTAPALAAAADSAATTGPSRWTAPRLRLGDGSDAPVND